MLRDGFRNSVMDEYLAGTCAVSGGLLEALEPDDIDDELFDGASDILAALAHGGPAEDLSDYADGRAAVARWLDHVEARGFSLKSIAALDSLSDAPLPDALSNRIEQLRRSLDAEVVVRAALQSDDAQTFATAAQAANRRGIDTTDRLQQRAEAGDRYATFELFRLVDDARIDAALDVMRGRLDLEALGSGPARELGLGDAFRDQFDLESVVNGLARFPGRGSEFVLSALRSPVVRNRHAAIRTIRTWGVPHETPDMRAALERAETIEPDDRVRAAVAAALAGEPLEAS
jgi:hypothetical protein